MPPKVFISDFLCSNVLIFSTRLNKEVGHMKCARKSKISMENSVFLADSGFSLFHFVIFGALN